MLGEALCVQTGADIPVQILPTVLEDPLHGVVETAQVVEYLERGRHLCRVLINTTEIITVQATD